MGVSTGAMGGGGLMALGSELLSLGLGMEQIQTVGKEVFAYAREKRAIRSWAKFLPRFPGCPNSSSERWRWPRSQASFPPIPKPMGESG